MTLQDIDVTIDQTLKELKGQYKFPDDVAPADMKCTVKVGSGRVSINMFNQLFFADQYDTGETVVPSEPSLETIPSTSAYTVTITPPGTGVFGIDLGVQYASSLQPLQKVSTPSAVGQYSVNTSTGLYTFYSGDAGVQVLISYTYTVVSGHKLVVNNQVMGYGPTFELWLAEPYQGTNGMHIFSARMSKLGIPIKRDDYVIIDMEGEAYPNAAGQVFEFFEAN